MRDADVRRAVRAMLDQRHAGDLDTYIVEEMGIWSGSVRIDIAVINGELCGFELKSDRDTLERLPLQSDLYSRVFDRVDLVIGRRHAQKAETYIPEWWGIQIASPADDGVSLRQKRVG
ncbi:MAG TPA: sce7726 family protein, partial [Xanthobacteraceae bacterium]|nr:sce7726 family protein [Xanthobacteraceae bacterium]